MQNNNISKMICKEISKKNGWDKETRRNVVTVGGEKWSFSVSSNPLLAECRQTYEDTVGFITKMPNGKILMKRMKSYANIPISRMASNGTKAYNVKMNDLSGMETYASK